MPKPVVASYVSDFLKSDMLHVYRQISGQTMVEPWVLTHKLENEHLFPFPDRQKLLVPKSPLRWFRKIYYRHVAKAPWQLFDHEVRHLLLELKRVHAELLHVYFGHSALHMARLIRSFPGPVVVSFHGADAGVDMQSPQRVALMQEVFRHAARVQARSESLKKDLIHLGCDPKKIRVQKTGIPLEDWRYAPRNLPADGAYKFFQSCRLIPKKGLDTALRAFAKIHDQYPKAVFEIAGDGPCREELISLARELRIEHAVQFLGFLPQEALREKVKESHFFFHPSRVTSDGNREGVPNAMLEAMASGACVLATYHGGIPEAVSSGESGILAEENDHEALAHAALRLMQSPQEREQICRAARRRIETDFNRERNMRELEEDYVTLIDAYSSAH